MNIERMVAMHRLILNKILKWCVVLLGEWMQNILLMLNCINNIILNGNVSNPVNEVWILTYSWHNFEHGFIWSSSQLVNIYSMLVTHRLIWNRILKWLGVLLGEWTQNICCMWLMHSCINNIILNGNVSNPADGVWILTCSWECST